ncbi:hypothetical protein PCANC_23103 [Puccinia coronata f. sp. avenae]|uniref:Uncharacterized protein n=1 Tax=Puccinia coronata f. sp. avenae TaxID=200324 RepID=A0A2N5U6K0_9BASI|nr:hypothetical protein PCANC_23103 [Puccinia coronata f. sp. avenae]
MQVVSLIPSTSPLRASRTSRRAQAALRSAAWRSEQQQHSGINPAHDFMEICTGRESSRETPHGPLSAGDSNEISEGASTRLQVTSSINRRRKSALVPPGTTAISAAKHSSELHRSLWIGGSRRHSGSRSDAYRKRTGGSASRAVGGMAYSEVSLILFKGPNL